MRRLAIFIGLISCWACSRSQEDPQTTNERLFQQLPGETTGVDFTNSLKETETLNIIEYLYFYNGAGVATGDINNDGLADLVFTSNQGPDRLYLNLGDLKFKDISRSAKIGNHSSWSTGVTLADVNEDGWLDIYICEVGGYKTLKGRNRLYINQQDLTFVEAAADYGLDFQGLSTQSAFLDYDLDGDLDLYLLCHSVHAPENYRPAEMRHTRDSLAGDRLYRNDGGKFVDVTAEAGIYSSKIGYGLGLSIGDLNGDGLPDIYVGNDFHENDYLYLNQGDGTFKESLESTLSYSSQFSMGNDIADVNNDGLLDIFTLDMKPSDPAILKRSVGNDAYDVFQFKVGYGYHYQYPRNMLQLNQKQPATAKEPLFSEVGQLMGIDATDWSWSALFADLDNDGWKDLFVTNGISRRPNDLDYLKFLSDPLANNRQNTDEELWSLMPEGRVSNCAFQNLQGNGYSEVSSLWGLDHKGISQGASFADLDNDGDLDIVVNNFNEPASLYENRGKSPNHYLQIAPRRREGNTFALGTMVWLHTEEQVQTQYLQTTRGFMSAVEPLLHFGLGIKDEVDSLVVQWPSGDREVWYDLEADQRLTLMPGQGQAVPAETTTDIPMFTEVLNDTLPRYLENDYRDINVEKLIPHLWSRQGPVMAAGDIDGDGQEEIYLGAASNQLPSLLNTEGGRLPVQKFLVEAIGYEDTAAEFFDANQDGHWDLYVGSGGNEFPPGHPALKDRLYLNDGKGNLREAAGALPMETANNTGAIAPADFDGDGDIDLFVGVSVIHGSYGVEPYSYLLTNNGNGTYQVLSEPKIKGMITSATWSDLDLDGRQDLLLAGEWMPLTIYYNKEQGFQKDTIPHTSGWWRSIAVADIDQDGDPDLIAGNHGLNSFLKATPQNPLHLYVNDFDDNESTEALITYYRNDREHAFATKDELEQQLPFIRKPLTSYQQYAQKDFQEVIPIHQYPGTTRLRTDLLASVYVENLRGTFRVSELPMEAQVTTLYGLMIRDFNSDGHLDVIAAGNFYHNQIAIGRLAAGSGIFLQGDGQGNFKAWGLEKSGLQFKGEIRDLLEVVNEQGQKVLVASRNQDTPQIFIRNQMP